MTVTIKLKLRKMRPWFRKLESINCSVWCAEELSNIRNVDSGPDAASFQLGTLGQPLNFIIYEVAIMRYPSQNCCKDEMRWGVYATAWHTVGTVEHPAHSRHGASTRHTVGTVWVSIRFLFWISIGRNCRTGNKWGSQMQELCIL